MTEAKHVPESGAIGPRREQTGDRPDAGFEDLVAALSDGELLIPAVLNHVGAVALASDTASARDMDLNRLIRSLHYKVHVSVHAPQHPDLGEREIVNTVAHGLNPLVGLLESLLDEIAELQARKNERTPDGRQNHSQTDQ